MAGKPKDPSERKSFTLRVRMTEADRALIEAAARVKSLEASSWVRSEIVALARKVIGRK